MFTSGRVNYEVADSGEATCFGGIAAVHRLVSKLGLVEAIDDELELLRVHLPYHESDHVLNMAYNVLCGGTRLEDIERLRDDVAYMNALGAELIGGSDHRGGFLSPLRRRGRGSADGGRQRGASAAVGRAGR